MPAGKKKCPFLICMIPTPLLGKGIFFFLNRSQNTGSMVGRKWDFTTTSPGFKNIQHIRGAQEIFVEEMN